MDIAGALDAALVADGTAAVEETPAGFEVVWKDPPAALRLDEAGRLDLEAAAEGLQVTAAAPIPCPVSVAFGAATKPPLVANPDCLYGSTRCGTPEKRHTGIDFSGDGKAVAIALGTVAKVETLSKDDHGMGNNIRLRHLLPGPNCAIVYSTYSHLASIDPAIVEGAAVVKGQTLGVIGGSGFNDPEYYGHHLHLELKSSAISGNPFGVGTQKTTCNTDPLNAKAETCWGYVATAASPPDAPDDYGYLDPAGYLNKTLTVPVYRQVSAGWSHTCALKPDNTLACWGENGAGQATPPAGTFQQVSTSWYHTCALKPDNTLACWGDNANGQAAPPAGIFKQVSAGGSHTCALKTNNTLACWGINGNGQATLPAGTLQQVSADGGHHTCALKPDNTLACWGSNANGQATPPAGTFQQVSAGESHTCALKINNTLACWGDNAYGQATRPAGTFQQVSSGSVHNCGIRTDGFVACWGAAR